MFVEVKAHAPTKLFCYHRLPLYLCKWKLTVHQLFITMTNTWGSQLIKGKNIILSHAFRGFSTRSTGPVALGLERGNTLWQGVHGRTIQLSSRPERKRNTFNDLRLFHLVLPLRCFTTSHRLHIGGQPFNTWPSGDIKTQTVTVSS